MKHVPFASAFLSALHGGTTFYHMFNKDDRGQLRKLRHQILLKNGSYNRGSNKIFAHTGYGVIF